MTIRFRLDGEEVRLPDVAPHRPLLHVLRERGLSAVKEGCAEGECGACALLAVREGPDGAARLQAFNSCLLPVGAADGMELWSARGVAARAGGLHPAQRLLAERGGSQCGFCTPGFVASLLSEQHRPGRRPAEADPAALGGNLCRCTGYRPILQVLAELPEPGEQDPFVRRLREPPPRPEPFEHEAVGVRFVRPGSLPELLELLARHPEARLVAGGTDLQVEINLRGTRPALLVSLEAVEELRRIEDGPEALTLGAAVPLSHLEERLAEAVPMLGQLLPLFASRLVRSRATLGGNLATASPIGDGAPALLALDAQLLLASAEGRRTLPLHEFFTGYRRTALRAGEVLEAVRIPRPLPQVQRFYKVSKRVLDDISTVAAGFGLWLDEAGRIVRARLAYGGVAPTPARAEEAERALLGEPLGPALRDRALPALREAFAPIDDHRGSAAYRREMVVRLFEKLLWEAAERPEEAAAPAPAP